MGRSTANQVKGVLDEVRAESVKDQIHYKEALCRQENAVCIPTRGYQNPNRREILQGSKLIKYISKIYCIGSELIILGIQRHV